MKSPVIIIASLLLLVSITSCDPFQPLYRDIEGSWEVTNITIGERTDRSGQAIADTSFAELGVLEFAECSKDAHNIADCDYELSLPSGEVYQLQYQIIDVEDMEFSLGGSGAEVPEQFDLSGGYFVSVNENEMMLTNKPQSSPLLAFYYQGRSISITLNRK